MRVIIYSHSIVHLFHTPPIVLPALKHSLYVSHISLISAVSSFFGSNLGQACTFAGLICSKGTAEDSFAPSGVAGMLEHGIVTSWPERPDLEIVFDQRAEHHWR